MKKFLKKILMKQKLIFLVGNIENYRIPMYNYLSNIYDLTVAYSKENRVDNSQHIGFSCKKINNLSFGQYSYVKKIYSIVRDFNIIVFEADMHHISYCFLCLFARGKKVISWSIGFRVSYSRFYDTNRQHTFLDWVYLQLLKRSDACLFYMPEALNFWNDRINRDKVFIARNTVDVLPRLSNIKKGSILFIGSLYKEKGILDLLYAFDLAINNCVDYDLKLEIVGNGEEYGYIQKFVQEHKLQDSVVLHGAIYEERKVREIFSRSLACISPNQAGLSVLKSFGYGVPFITSCDSITGGEKFNIVDDFNGILYDNDVRLDDILKDIYSNKLKYIEMGENSYRYYSDNCTIRSMSSGIIDAVNYVV